MPDPAAVALYYTHVFPARRDVYSVWTPEGWRPVRRELTADLVLAALTGRGPSLSGFLIAPGNTTHALALDFDTDTGLAQSFAVARVMADDGIPAYVEPSRRGAHLWCVLDGVIPAVAARFALRALIAAAGLPQDPKIELRPGSDVLSDGGVGHALRLPLMPHPKTGHRGQMLDADRTPIGRTLAEVLLNLEWAPAARIAAWSERWHPPVERIPKEYRTPHAPFPDEDASASGLLAEFWRTPNARPGKAVRCGMHDDAHPSLSVTADDERAICHSPECVLFNGGRGYGTWQLRHLAPGAR